MFENDKTRFAAPMVKLLKPIVVALALLVTLVRPPIAGVIFAQAELTKTNPNPTGDSPAAAEIFRLERTPVEGGAELITIIGRLDGLPDDSEEKWTPLVTVLRDTLGDNNPENDRLRYLWPLSYTRPSFWQRVSGAVPFLYTRVGNKEASGDRPPPPALDLAAPDKEVWEKIFWVALQNVLFDPYGTPVKASSRSYRRNISDYRQGQIIRALSVLSLYQSLKGTPLFTDAEMAEIQARLLLTDKTFGGIVDDLNLQAYYEKKQIETRDERGHNWELLRQRAEAESLYFEPLAMPDGSATHALLWIARSELAAKHDDRYSKRFLNISNPWKDARLLQWQGYTETRYFDADNRPVAPNANGAIAKEMIPLALYGLDNPKIPLLLVDFRDTLNPKKREMSRRVLEDLTRNVLSLSRFGDLPYFLGRTVFDFVTGRRGMDVNQPSRFKVYSQLKLLLALNESLSSELREDIRRRAARVSLNPMENDLKTEARIAQRQYSALLDYAARPDGLAARLERDRRAELVPLSHSKTEQVLFRLANILTFGKYTHREPDSFDLSARLDTSRRLSYHTRFLRTVSKSGPGVDVKWDLAEIRRSLAFIAEHGADVSSQAIGATGRIFFLTDDFETRRICLESLTRIGKPKARNELIRISQNEKLEQSWKDLIGSYLAKPLPRPEPLAAANDKSATGREEQR